MPLRVNLGQTAQRESIQPFVVAQIAKHWFNRTHALTVEFSAEYAIDRSFHDLYKGDG